MSENENDLKEWLKGNQSVKLSVQGFSDDDPEEEIVGTENVSLDDSDSLNLQIQLKYPLPQATNNDLIFIDGTSRYRVIGSFKANNVLVPIVFGNIIAGAMRLDAGNKTLRPLKVKILKVVLFPKKTIEDYQSAIIPLPPNIPIIEDNSSTKFMNFSNNLVDTFIRISDISYTLGENESGQHRQLIYREDLISSGKIRQVARNRVKELMRVLELSLLYELRQLYKDSLILMDGPIGPLIKYAGLVDIYLREVVRLRDNDSNNIEKAYDLLHNVIGVVKKVVKVPVSLIDAISSGNLPKIYRWNKVIDDGIDAEGKEDSYLTSYILSAFLKLREELQNENFPAFSNLSGLIRVDIPLASIIDKSEWISFFSYTQIKDSDDKGNIILTDYGRQKIYDLVVKGGKKLEELLNIVYSFKYPIPSSSPYRNLVELYPIKEVEDWMKSHLMSKYEMASYVYS
ncbi:hypothetical protein [Sulfolobus acidocaldarius]|uniref:NurA domain-containing protein n=4 Tax=Sulfolobus acidocaldarius TaxID=2285 RepID=Q4JBF0_SULAC|nr:hypothetical protein [Sulfolobus acidocaldarius]AAY79879.1 hypothetical protein Saci_0473 [Sulfolobus acidocaldarius DSM 639]AGE70441.1 hypothetical protein SacN8_02305 [Sulfolobus acidocaldarius N8]AGE72715.1 hypothetical protein SacRon12I_02300 [Sulfolobus acidocaldarius Ron12/I]ALU29175.1 hypothetical protein ATY89_03960 [Sulfolobus acidocaldarius]ALU31901.1 hypothetical protein ATZ20_06985 [Sulfolobus acidocaldarius]